MERKKVIIDTDPGIDDFLALILAKSSEILDIRGITAVAGNQTLDKIAKNALGIAEFLKLDAPVAKGADKPLIFNQVTASIVHGDTGLGNFKLPVPSRDFDSRYAWDLIYDEAVAAKGELSIISIAPMTNIAIALYKYPELKHLIKNITAMGGSTENGNIGILGEFNFYVDPHAARSVFRSGIPINMIGLNVTSKTSMNDEEFGTLQGIKCKKPDDFFNLMNLYRSTHTAFGSQKTIAMHDSLAVAYEADPSILTMLETYVEIETGAGLCRGRSIINRNAAPNSKIAVDLDKKRFLSMVKDSFRIF